jgi:ribosomal protein L7/L12
MTNGSSQSPALPQTAIAALEKGNTIEAIKIVRLERGLGLKESKDQVDAYLKSRPDLQRRMETAQAEARQGFVRWLVTFLALAAAAAYFVTQGK